MAKPWIPQVRYPVIHGSSQWMKEMAFVICISGVRTVLRVVIESELPQPPLAASTFIGHVHPDSQRWPQVGVFGYYDASFPKAVELWLSIQLAPEGEHLVEK